MVKFEKLFYEIVVECRRYNLTTEMIGSIVMYEQSMMDKFELNF